MSALDESPQAAARGDVRDLLRSTAEQAADFLADGHARPVAAVASLDELRARLVTPLADEAVGAEAVIEQLVRDTRGGLLGTTGPRFFGWVIGGTLPAALAADWLTSTWDQNAALYACAPAEAVIEEACRDWIVDLLGLGERTSMALLTGCQMAHFTALAAARGALLRRQGWDVESDGLFGAPPIRILATRHRHITIDRAVRMLGLGTRAIVEVDADDRGRLDPASLETLLSAEGGPTIVVAQAGDLNTGFYDPLDETVALARRHDAWVHVDGAFGLWAAASPRHRHLLRGFEGADSWATDGHKWLNVPYDCGIALVADPDAHRAAMSSRASSYLVYAEGARDQIDWNPEWSRRGRGVALYAALRQLGRHGVADLVDRTCRLAARLTSEIGALPGAELLSPALINQGLVRFLDPAGDHDRRTDAVIQAIQDEGTAWFGGTTWNGIRAMRISVSGWNTTDHDVDLTVAAVERVLGACA